MNRIGLVLGIMATMTLTLVEVSHAQVLNVPAIERACAAAAAAENSAVRAGKKTKMWCAVVDREGKLLAINATDTGGTPAAPAGSDAWRGSIEIAIAKAYTAVAFSSNDQSLDSRQVGLATRQDGPGSTASTDIGTDAGVASLWGLSASNPFRSAFGLFQGGVDFIGGFHHGIITFAGGQPVYTKVDASACGTPGGTLIGAVGVSGDGVDEDDAVAQAAVLNANFCITP